MKEYKGLVFEPFKKQDIELLTPIMKRAFIESEYPGTVKWQTETPGFSMGNHHFYIDKCGFRLVRIESRGNKHEESYILEKEMTEKTLLP